MVAELWLVRTKFHISDLSDHSLPRNQSRGEQNLHRDADAKDLLHELILSRSRESRELSMTEHLIDDVHLGLHDLSCSIAGTTYCRRRFGLIQPKRLYAVEDLLSHHSMRGGAQLHIVPVRRLVSGLLCHRTKKKGLPK